MKSDFGFNDCLENDSLINLGNELACIFIIATFTKLFTSDYRIRKDKTTPNEWGQDQGGLYPRASLTL